MSFKRKTVENVGENVIEIGARSSLPGRKRVRKGDIIALVLSVLVAIFMWLYVMRVESPTAEMDFFGVKVTVENEYKMKQAKGWSLISEGSTTVDVKLRGKKSTLNRMKSEDVVAYVDLLQVAEVGESSLPVQFKLPDGITCISAQDAQVRVDKIISNTVPLEASILHYSSSADLILGDLVCDVKELKLTGPASVVEMVDHAAVQIDMNGEMLTGSQLFSAAPVLLDINGQPVRSNDLVLDCDSVIVRQPVSMAKDVPLSVTYKYGYLNDKNITVEIEPATIRVVGEPSVIQELDTIPLGVLDETDEMMKEDEAAYNMPITLPSGVTTTEDAKSAVIRLRHEGTQVKQITVSRFDVSAPEGMKYRVPAKSLVIYVRCSSNLAGSLTADDVTAGIDLHSVVDPTGSVTRKVTVNLSDRFSGSAYVLGTYEVVVELGVSDETFDAEGVA